MVDTNAPPSTRVRAADTILNHTTKAIEIEDIAARVHECSSSVRFAHWEGIEVGRRVASGGRPTNDNVY